MADNLLQSAAAFPMLWFLETLTPPIGHSPLLNDVDDTDQQESCEQ
jgi:hypothetical protein